MSFCSFSNHNLWFIHSQLKLNCRQALLAPLKTSCWSHADIRWLKYLRASHSIRFRFVVVPTVATLYATVHSGGRVSIGTGKRNTESARFTTSIPLSSFSLIGWDLSLVCHSLFLCKQSYLPFLWYAFIHFIVSVCLRISLLIKHRRNAFLQLLVFALSRLIACCTFE